MVNNHFKVLYKGKEVGVTVNALHSNDGTG